MIISWSVGRTFPKEAVHTGFEQCESNQRLSNMRPAMSDVATLLAGQLDSEAASEGVDYKMPNTVDIKRLALPRSSATYLCRVSGSGRLPRPTIRSWGIGKPIFRYQNGYSS